MSRLRGQYSTSEAAGVPRAICLVEVPYHAGDDRHDASAGPSRLIESGAAELLREQRVVGAVLPNLTVGQILSPSTQLLTRDGDINQEDITNNAVLAWRAMAPCFHFGLTDNAGVDHFSLPSHPDLLDRLVFDLGIDSRTNTYCKRQVIRERYAGQIEVATFNAVLASGQTLEAALAQAMAAKH
jgi:hypothetical protein